MLIALAVVVGLVLLMFVLEAPDEVVTGPADTAEQTGDPAEGDQGAGSEDDTQGSDTGDDSAGQQATDTTVPTIPDTVPPADPRVPAEVSVLVANGTGERGVAGAITDRVTARGYLTLEPANAPTTGDSRVFYREGYDADAVAVAEIVGSTPDIVLPVPVDGVVAVAANAIEDGRADSANVIVIVGNDGRIPIS